MSSDSDALHPCPFYGFTTQFTSLGLWEIGDGRCPLKKNEEPCHMEQEGKIPSWKECKHGQGANGEYNERRHSNLKVSPKELLPGCSFSFEKWKDIVLESQTE